MLGQFRDRVPIGQAGGDVGPLPRVRALGEKTAEDVEGRRRLAQDPVRMLVDQADRR
jgi:hypothetical protein